MPIEDRILKDDIRGLEDHIDNLTRRLKDMDPDSRSYALTWDERVDIKYKLEELKKLDTY